MKKRDWMNLGILTFTLFVFIFATLGVENIYGSTTDWISQHWAFPEYFRTLFYETGSLFPDFAPNIGAGQNIYYFAYYGFLNPIFMISYALPFISMKDYIIVVSILSVLATVLLFYKWLLNHGFSSSICLIASALVLCASPLLFHSHRHIMFIQYLPFLILGLMGIDQYFQSKRKSLFIFGTFMMIMTSYYYSVCGLLVFVLYGISCYIKKVDKMTFQGFIKDGFCFCLPLFIALFMSFILLLPTLGIILQGKGGAEASISLMSLFIPRFSLDPLLYSSYSLGFTSIALFALVATYFCKEKHLKFLGIAVSVLCWIPLFMYLLNGGLYIRAKVLIPLLPIIGYFLAYFLKQLLEQTIPLKKIMFTIFCLTIVLWFSHYRLVIYYIDLMFMFILLFLYFKFHKKVVIVLGIITISFFQCYVCNAIYETYVTKESYEHDFNQETQQLVDEITQEDSSWYRMANLDDTLTTINKVYNGNYYQTTLYSSTHNAIYNQFYFDIFKNAIPYRNRVITPSTNHVLFQMLMGVKYVISRDGKVPAFYHQIKEKNGIGLYKSDVSFPLGYATDQIISTQTFSTLSYPDTMGQLLTSIVVENQDLVPLKSLFKETELKIEKIIGSSLEVEEKELIRVSAKKSDTIVWKLLEPLKNQGLVVVFDMKYNQSCSQGDTSIDINGITNKLTCKQWMYHNQNHTFEYVLSSNDEIKELVFTFSKGKFELENLKFYTFDLNEVKSFVENIDPFVVEERKQDFIKGSIEVSSDGYFATTLPYDEGFKVRMDGKEISYEKVNEGFVGFPITAGKHEIEIRYQAPLKKLGMIGSIIGFIVFFIIFFWERKKQKVLL